MTTLRTVTGSVTMKAAALPTLAAAEAALASVVKSSAADGVVTDAEAASISAAGGAHAAALAFTKFKGLMAEATVDFKVVTTRDDHSGKATFFNTFSVRTYTPPAPIKLLSGTVNAQRSQTRSVADVEKNMTASVKAAVADGKLSAAETSTLDALAREHAAALAFAAWPGVQSLSLNYRTDIRPSGGWLNTFSVAPNQPQLAGPTYTVKGGDTMTAICTALKNSPEFAGSTVTVQELMLVAAQKNRLANASQIREGQVLAMPTLTDLRPPAPGGTYTLRPGDTLWSVAERCMKAAVDQGTAFAAGTTVAQVVDKIVAANPGKISNPNLVIAGATIKLPTVG